VIGFEEVIDMGRLAETYGTLLEGVSFASRAHDGQLRKDNRTPYVAHVFRVCLIVRHVFGLDDPRALLAALLHDTIEDTRTDYDDLLKLLGGVGHPVADWVAALSKDKRREEPEREAAYLAALASAPWQVKVCKLADVFDNLLDSRQLTDAQLQRTLGRARDALAVLREATFPDADRATGPALHQRALTFVTELVEEVAVGRQVQRPV
jgi:guanosine-3',5'-bis(diphosphate) 3'-pyrophosphohydrolase